MKDGLDAIMNRNPGTTRTAEKWQGYLLGNYKFYWSQVWDPLRTGKEAAFIWSIWHKAVAVNEWRANIALASISKQYFFASRTLVSQSNINLGLHPSKMGMEMGHIHYARTLRGEKGEL